MSYLPTGMRSVEICRDPTKEAQLTLNPRYLAKDGLCMTKLRL